MFKIPNELFKRTFSRSIFIDKNKVSLKFMRSSGPGGQNVNKVSTKVELRFNVNDSEWLPSDIKNRFKEMYSSRINKNGEFVIQSDVNRTQHENIEEILERAQNMLDLAAIGPTEPTLEQKLKVKNLIKLDIERNRNSKSMNKFLKKKYDDK